MTPSVASRADINAQQSKDPGEKRRVMRTQDHGGSAQKSSTTWGKRIRDKIPPWITRNLANTKSWKLLVRCWVASWATVVLLLPNRSLHALGNAAFFAGVASIILPPNMPIQSFVFAVTMLIIGCLLGWAWGSAAMAAALRTRNAAATRAALAQVSSSGANSENSARFLQESVFRGAFLDTKSSIVFGVFLGVGAFILGLTRAKNPKLTIPTIFATIFLDVFCSYGPLFPTAQYNLLDTFVISTACYIAIALAVIILIFPETLNHQWMSSYIDLVSAVHELIQIQEKVLQVRIEELDSDVEKNTLLNQIQNKGADLLKSFQALSEKSKMLEMEFTYGQLSGADLKLFELPMRNLVTRTRGLQSFLTLLTDHIEWGRQDWIDDEAPDAQPIDARSRPLSPNEHNETAVEMEESTESNGLHIGDTYLLLHGRQRYQYLESVHHLRIQELLPILRSATSDLRSACLGGCDAAKSTFLIINTNRYKRKAQRLVHVEDGKEARLSEESEDVSTALTKLKTALKDYTENRRHEILEPFKPFLVSFDDIQVDREGRLPFSLRPLFLCFVFQSNLIWTAESLISLLTLVQAAQRKRPSRRLWAPKGIRSIVHLWRGGPNHSPLGEDLPPIDDAPSSDDEDVEPEKRYCRDPDSCPPQHIGHKLGQALYKGYMWTSRPETIFATKYTVLTILLWLPAVIKSSAYFTYAERGLWGLIMAQMTLQIWISDQIYFYVGRIGGTVLGGLIGMVAWYMGSGRGVGNPYGVAASSALLLAPLVFYRLFGPIPLNAIMSGITAVLVVGYSWVDTHLNTVGNPGVGWHVTWRRIVLVLIGCAASAIMMLLPPQSQRRNIRVSNAATITSISHLYTTLVSNWLTDIEKDECGSDSDSDTIVEEAHHTKSLRSFQTWAPAFRQRLITVSSRLQVLRIQTATAKWEGSIRGAWPFEKYDKMLAIQSKMINNLVQLSGSLSQLSPQWRKNLLHETAVLNPNLISEVVAVFGIVAMSLRNGSPMHEVLPHSLVDRTFYHESLTRRNGRRANSGTTSGILKKDVLRSIEFAHYATGVAAVFQILKSLDELHQVTRELCGEVPLQGFQDWREAFELRQIRGSVG